MLECSRRLPQQDENDRRCWRTAGRYRCAAPRDKDREAQVAGEKRESEDEGGERILMMSPSKIERPLTGTMSQVSLPSTKVCPRKLPTSCSFDI